MPNINRTDDVSQQQEIITIGSLNTGGGGSALIASGSTMYASYIVPRAMQIQSAQVTCIGISGAPQALLGCLRFLSTASFVIGTTTLIPAFGTSGYMSYSIGAAGSTTLNLAKGDLLALQQLGGSSAASTSTMMTIVVKNLQDIKSWY